MRITLLTLILFTISCGMKHTADGKVETEAKGKVTVDITSTICDDDEFTPKQKLACIEALTSLSVDTEGLGELLDSEEE